MISLHATLCVSEECNRSYVFKILPSQHSQDSQNNNTHVWDDL